jgi:uncharacterized protein YPO0396
VVKSDPTFDGAGFVVPSKWKVAHVMEVARMLSSFYAKASADAIRAHILLAEDEEPSEGSRELSGKLNLRYARLRQLCRRVIHTLKDVKERAAYNKENVAAAQVDSTGANAADQPPVAAA